MECELETERSARRAFELRLSQIESPIASRVVHPMTLVTPQSLAPDGGRTRVLECVKSSSFASGFVGMIMFV
jgi:hypothetical protein